MKSIYDHSDTGNAELLNDLYGKDIRYDPKTDRWLQWRNGHRWFEVTEPERYNLAIKTANHRFELAKDMPTENAKREVGFAIRARNLANIQNTLSVARNLPPIGSHSVFWDNQPNLLVVGNGVVNLSNSTIRPGQRSDFLTQGIHMPYVPNSSAPIWERFLRDITLGNEELIGFIQRAIGYTLTGFTTAQVFFMLYGGGSNGKSVLINILNELLEGFSRTIRFSAFEETTTSDAKRDLAELPGIRVTFASESGKKSALDTSIIKQITGGEPITTSRKYGHPFTFKPQFKLWLTTNHLPKVDDDSLGFWRRLIIIPFDAIFEGSARDNQMQQKLEAELPGILAWAIRGAAIWSRDGLNTPNSLLLKVSKYREAADTYNNFIEEMCVKKEGGVVRASILYEVYKMWCEQMNCSAVSNAEFGQKMSTRFERNHDRLGWYYSGLEVAMVV